ATSQEGLDAEWRIIDLFTVDGDLMNRCEMFDEEGLDAALARFEELNRPVRPLENDATRIWALLVEAFNQRDLEGYLALGDSGLRYEDRRRGMRDDSEGAAEQRRAVLALFGATPSSTHRAAEPIAVRGCRLALMHV